MLRRLDTDRWDDTDPEALNRFAATLDPGAPARFVSLDEREQSVRAYNRTWVD